ncbi:MAG TPA: isocitrate lyase/phosphoenolpyruvate mutase family protein [Candidatus Binatus sp.]|nr:isocitrate lyase/phosphoenolpyruvate mutase family protein [Candidatus Binatus sp.]
MNDQQKRQRLRELLAASKGVIAPGVTDAICARLVQDCGYEVAHLSGNAIHKNFCLPDRNLLTPTQIGQRIGQISEASDIPLIVDGGSICAESLALTRAVKLYERAGAAAIRFEDALVNEYGAAAEELVIAPTALVVDRIKAAIDARRDPALAIIARCDSRPVESLDHVGERLAAYAAAGADAVGVQLSDVDDFRRIGARPPAPLVTLWPKAQMSAFEFFQLGFRIALTPSSLPLAAIAGARAMLLDLKQSGTDRDYFAKQNGFAETEAWYKKVGATPK